jgi:hypothetical protein
MTMPATEEKAVKQRSRVAGLVLAAILLLAVPVALLAAPRVLGFDDSEGVFVQLGIEILVSTMTLSVFAFASLPGIQYTVTRPQNTSQYLGWKPKRTPNGRPAVSPKPVTGADARRDDRPRRRWHRRDRPRP